MTQYFTTYRDHNIPGTMTIATSGDLPKTSFGQPRPCASTDCDDAQSCNRPHDAPSTRFSTISPAEWAELLMGDMTEMICCPPKTELDSEYENEVFDEDELEESDSDSILLGEVRDDRGGDHNRHIDPSKSQEAGTVPTQYFLEETPTTPRTGSSTRTMSNSVLKRMQRPPPTSMEESDTAACTSETESEVPDSDSSVASRRTTRTGEWQQPIPAMDMMYPPPLAAFDSEDFCEDSEEDNAEDADAEWSDEEDTGNKGMEVPETKPKKKQNAISRRERFDQIMKRKNKTLANTLETEDGTTPKDAEEDSTRAYDSVTIVPKRAGTRRGKIRKLFSNRVQGSIPAASEVPKTASSPAPERESSVAAHGPSAASESDFDHTTADLKLLTSIAIPTDTLQDDEIDDAVEDNCSNEEAAEDNVKRVDDSIAAESDVVPPKESGNGREEAASSVEAQPSEGKKGAQGFTGGMSPEQIVKVRSIRRHRLSKIRSFRGITRTSSTVTVESIRKQPKNAQDNLLPIVETVKVGSGC